MTEIVTISPDQLAEAVALAALGNFVVFTPGGPLQRLDRANLIETDPTLASDSDDAVPAVSAVRAFIATALAGLGGFTAEDARDIIGAALAELAGIDITVNDAGDIIQIAIDLSEVEASDSEMWTGSSSVKAVTPKKIFDAAIPQALADGATVTPNFNAGLNFEWTIGGNRTLANPTNAKAGQSGTIKIVQDGTGSRILAYGNNWRFPGGAATGGLLSTAAAAIDIIAYTVGNDGKLYATLSKAFAA